MQNPDTMTEKPFDLRERTFQFALRILDITSRLPDRPEANVARGQLVRAGTSVGANVEEADGAMTKSDTRRVFVIARKETREARYWLKIIERKWPSHVDVRQDVREATQILSILSAVIKKLS